MIRRRIAPHNGGDTAGQLLSIAGAISGIACLVLVPTLHRLAVLVSDRLLGPARVQTTLEGGSAVACDLAPHRWVGGLAMAFVAGMALLVSGGVRSRTRLSVKQYWVATVLLALASLGGAFLVRAL